MVSGSIDTSTVEAQLLTLLAEMLRMNLALLADIKIHVLLKWTLNITHCNFLEYSLYRHFNVSVQISQVAGTCSLLIELEKREIKERIVRLGSSNSNIVGHMNYEASITFSFGFHVVAYQSARPNGAPVRSIFPHGTLIWPMWIPSNVYGLLAGVWCMT